MLKRLTALFAILVLLLPSSVAAFAYSCPADCSSQQAIEDCCCSVEEPVSHNRSAMESDCGCHLQAPSFPPAKPNQERADWNASLQVDFGPPAEDAEFPFVARSSQSADGRFCGLRAPPLPLYLVFQSFLN